MARIKEHFVIVLEPDRVLSVDELAVLTQAAATQSATGAANDNSAEPLVEEKAA
jgi:hypothetical protein